MKIKLKLRRLSREDEKIGYVAAVLGIYFLCLPFDALVIEGLGSILRLISLLAVCLILLNFRRCRMKLDKLSVSVIVILLCHFFSLCYTIDWENSFGMFQTMLMNVALVIMAGALYPFCTREIRMLRNCLVWSGVLTVILTFIYSDSAFGRLTLNFGGVAQDANYLNGYLLFAVAFFFEQLVRNKKKRYLIPIILTLAFSMLTGSRGALLAIVAVGGASTCFSLKVNSVKKEKALAVFMVLLFVAIFSYGYILDWLPEDIAQRFDLKYIAEHGTTGRLDSWENLLNVFAEAPVPRQLFGFGSGTTIRLNSPDEYGNIYVAHNLWIEQLMNLGIIGLLALIYMQIVFFKAVLRQKDVTMISTYIGYLVMSMSLSIVSYKPMWNCMIMIMIMKYNTPLRADNVRKLPDCAESI